LIAIDFVGQGTSYSWLVSSARSGVVNNSSQQNELQCRLEVQVERFGSVDE
jgi:hypothetical protein